MKHLFILCLSVMLLSSCGGGEHKHTYDFENGQWTWNEIETGYSASFTVTCNNCDEKVEGHSLVLDATVTKRVEDPTCTADGATIYTATVEYENKSYSDTKQIKIDKLDHNYTSMTVEGNYPKNYQAFDTFDDSGLTVKVVCGTCGHEETISKDDYFIVYSSFGAESLSVGDTSVTISYNGLRKVLDGLTVSPLTNEITGFNDSYETTCGVKPDFSGVSSTANDVEIHYYKDSEMSEEVQENELSAGSYYIKAVSGGNNYAQVEKTATLTVNHVFDQEVIDDKYVETPASEYEDGVYYKSCICGEHSDTETFVAKGTKLPSIVSNTSYEPSEVVNEAAPEGYSVVTKGTIEYERNKEYQGKEFLKDIDINSYASVNFAFKTENRRLCDSKWGNPVPLNEWHFVTISKNQNGTFACVIKNSEGIVKFSKESATSFRNSILYYNWDGNNPETGEDDQPFMVWYSTEVIGVRPEPIGELVAGSSITTYESISENVPYGYSRVTKGTIEYSDSDQGKLFLANLDVSEYSSVFFAIKTENRRFCNSSWGSPLAIGQWFYITIEKNNDNTYNSIIKDQNGTEKFGYKNKNSFAESLPYYNWDGTEPFMVWYSTEVRGIKISNA